MPWYKRWYSRMLWAVIGFVVPWLGLSELIIHTVTSSDDLGIGILGLIGAFVAGVVGLIVALLLSNPPPRHPRQMGDLPTGSNWPEVKPPSAG